MRFYPPLARRRVVLFSSEDIIPNLILNHCLPEIHAMGLRAQVFLTPIPSRRTANPPALQRLSFYERQLPCDVLFPALERDTAGWGLTPHRELKTFNELARAYGDWYRIDSLDDSLVSEAFEHPEFLGAISAHNYLLFKARHIAQVRAREAFLWNLHHGPLPDNRGILAPFWNLLEGRSGHGVSLHEVTDGIDTGALIATARLRLSAAPSVLASMIELGVPGAHLVVQTLRRLVHGHPLPPLPQPARIGIYRSRPSAEDIAHAERRGIRLVGTSDEMANLFSDLYRLDAEFTAKELMPAIHSFEAQWHSAIADLALARPTKAATHTQASSEFTRFT